jgi:hypothetical protein
MIAIATASTTTQTTANITTTTSGALGASSDLDTKVTVVENCPPCSEGLFAAPNGYTCFTRPWNFLPEGIVLALVCMALLAALWFDRREAVPQSAGVLAAVLASHDANNDDQGRSEVALKYFQRWTKLRAVLDLLQLVGLVLLAIKLAEDESLPWAAAVVPWLMVDMIVLAVLIGAWHKYICMYSAELAVMVFFSLVAGFPFGTMFKVLFLVSKAQSESTITDTVLLAPVALAAGCSVIALLVICGLGIYRTKHTGVRKAALLLWVPTLLILIVMLVNFFRIVWGPSSVSIFGCSDGGIFLLSPNENLDEACTFGGSCSVCFSSLCTTDFG